MINEKNICPCCDKCGESFHQELIPKYPYEEVHEN